MKPGMPVFAMLAFLDFLVWFILGLTKTSTGDVNMLALGLTLLAAHFVWGWAWPLRTRAVGPP